MTVDEAMDLDDLSEEHYGGNVATLHDATVANHGETLAIESHGTELTHRELKAAADRFAGGLAGMGLEPGDPLLLFLPNCPQYIVASLGAMKAGVPISPVNPQYKSRELSYQLDDSGARAVLTHEALRPVLDDVLGEVDRSVEVITVGEDAPEGDTAYDEVAGEPLLAEVDEEAVAVLPYTSGTTGRPKGVQLTHRNFRAQMLATMATSSSDIDPEDVRSLVWLPLYHITGFTHTAFQPLIGGGAVFLRNPTDWDAGDAMALIESAGITSFVGVTAMYVDMVQNDSFGEYDLTSLVTASEGGAKMSVAVQEAFEAETGVDISEGYGLTETNGATHAQQGSTYGLRHGTIGQPLRHTDCRIVDEDGEEVPAGEEGELLVRGPQVMKGYHNMPEKTERVFTENGFFKTGDIARRDANNYYEIVDRKKHVIVSAGYNIYPSEVEELIREHDAVADVAVVGIPDERRNEVPKAFVVPARGVEPGTDVTGEEIKQFALDRIAEYKHPREVEFVEELPRTASGKVQKYQLRPDDGE
jgi:long-chain acyl-CoA synthetase